MDLDSLTNTLKLRSLPFIVRLDKHNKIAVLEKVKNTPLKSENLDLAALLAEIRELQIREVDEEGLKGAISEILDEKPFVLARAVEPVHGKNGYVKCSFDDKIAEQLWREDSGQKVDFRNRNEINNVTEGDLLAELMPPTPARDGCSVLGQPLVAKTGRATRLIAGKNVRFSEDKLKLYAETDGCVKTIKNRISVDVVKTIQGDVNFKCGNIEFKGDVVVYGDVNEGFSINAEGNISVEGVVDRAMLKAGGDITVESGLYGKEGIQVEAAGNITFGFAENANLKAGGNVYVLGSMVNCSTQAEEKVFLRATGKALIGGHIIANHGVEANSLGNPKMATKTIIEFGLRPELAKRVAHLKLELPTATKERRVEIALEVQGFKDEYQKQVHAKVIARHVTYPGVLLQSYKATFDVKNEIARMIFYKLEGKNEISTRGIGVQ